MFDRYLEGVLIAFTVVIMIGVVLHFFGAIQITVDGQTQIDMLSEQLEECELRAEEHNKIVDGIENVICECNIPVNIYWVMFWSVFAGACGFAYFMAVGFSYFKDKLWEKFKKKKVKK